MSPVDSDDFSSLSIRVFTVRQTNSMVGTEPQASFPFLEYWEWKLLAAHVLLTVLVGVA